MHGRFQMTPAFKLVLNDRNEVVAVSFIESGVKMKAKILWIAVYLQKLILEGQFNCKLYDV